MKYVFDLMNEDSIKNGLKEMLQESVRNAAYYDGDPEQGGKRITRNESPVFNGIIEAMVAATGLPYVPTDDAEKMIVARQEFYIKQLAKTKERRKWNSGKESTDSDIKEYRQLWLKEELENIDRWKTQAPQDRPEIIIELDKYKNYVSNEVNMIQTGTPPEIYSLCTAETFKTDIGELCDKCPLPVYIRTKIKAQITFQAQQQREILTNLQFIEYCNDEIKNAQKSMMETSLFVQQDKDSPIFRNARTLVFIWNKERIKELNRVQIEAAPTSISHQTSTPVNSTPTITDERSKERKQQSGTKKRYEQYKADFNNFQLLESKGTSEATRLAAKKHGVSIDTIERALGFKK
ncbi:hypothetical protein [Spirosoma arcticum]